MNLVIPEELRDYLVVEDCSTFDTDNFFLSEELKAIKEDIIKCKNTSSIMQNKLGLYFPNTTLLYGPPGTGKTTFAKYLAHEFNIDFAYVNFAKIFNGIFGKTTSILSDIFDFISDKDCIFVLDEIDCISQKRGTDESGTGGEISRVTITLMQCLDKLKYTKSNTIILGCTNRIDIMDPALKSRFSICKIVKGFTIAEKKRYIINFLNSVNNSLKEANMPIINYHFDNIDDYTAGSSFVTNRNIEMDLNRCIAQWLDDTSQRFVLENIPDFNR